MKECRGDTTIEISQRKQQSEKEIFSTPPNPYEQVYITRLFITQVYILTGVYYTGVYYTSIKSKRTAKGLDHRSAYNTSFLLKGT